MTYQFRQTRRVQFAETDLAGIVHFSNFYRYMEEAEHAFYRSLGFSVHDMPRDAPGSKVGWPRVHASADFRNPLRFEEEFDEKGRGMVDPRKIDEELEEVPIGYLEILDEDGERIYRNRALERDDGGTPLRWQTRNDRINGQKVVLRAARSETRMREELEGLLLVMGLCIPVAVGRGMDVNDLFQSQGVPGLRHLLAA